MFRLPEKFSEELSLQLQKDFKKSHNRRTVAVKTLNIKMIKLFVFTKNKRAKAVVNILFKKRR